MLIPGKPAKILLIDSNVLFAKRLGDALRREGFEVTATTQGTFALTALEYDAPAASESFESLSGLSGVG